MFETNLLNQFIINHKSNYSSVMQMKDLNTQEN